MKKLCDITELIVNNENCAVLRVLPDCRMDLIALGCFNGNEEFIRITKWDVTEVTIFYKDGSQFSYWWTPYEYVKVSFTVERQKQMIRDCFILDFGVVCEYAPHTSLPWAELVQSSLNDKECVRNIVVAPYGGNDCSILINEQVAILAIDRSLVEKWFLDRGYVAVFDADMACEIKQPVHCISLNKI